MDRATALKTGRIHTVIDTTGEAIRTLCGLWIDRPGIRSPRGSDSLCGACLKVKRDRARRGAQGYGDG